MTLAHHGYAVDAVDRSPGAIEGCARKRLRVSCRSVPQVMTVNDRALEQC